MSLGPSHGHLIRPPQIFPQGLIIPAGTIEISGSAAVPTGRLRCDGSLYDPVAFPDLFAAIGGAWGGGAATIGAWVPRVSGTTQQLNAVAYGGPIASRLHVAVGASNTVLWSDNNGVTWNAGTGIPGGGGAVNLQDVTWWPTLELWVAVGNKAGSFLVGDAYISSDGKAWVQSSAPPLTAGANHVSIAVLGGTAVATFSNANSNYWFTTDGNTWINGLIGGGVKNSVAASDSLFIAVGNAGEIFTSPNGTPASWTARVSGTAAALRSVGFSPSLGQALAVEAGGPSRISNDGGITWAAGSPGVATADLRKTRWLGNFFLTATNTNGRFDRRNTGAAAVTAVNTGYAATHYDCANRGDRLVAVGAAGDIRTADLTSTELRLPPSPDLFTIGASATRPLGTTGGSFTTSVSSPPSQPVGIVGLLSQGSPPGHTHQAVPPYMAIFRNIVHTNVFALVP